MANSIQEPKLPVTRWDIIKDVVATRFSQMRDGLRDYYTKDLYEYIKIFENNLVDLGFSRYASRDLAMKIGVPSYFAGRPVNDIGVGLGEGVARLRVHNLGESEFLEGVGQLSGSLSAIILSALGFGSVAKSFSKTTFVLTDASISSNQLALAGVSYGSLSAVADLTATAGVLNTQVALLQGSNDELPSSGSVAKKPEILEREALLKKKNFGTDVKIVTTLDDLEQNKFSLYVLVEKVDGEVELRVCSRDGVQVHMVLENERVVASGNIIYTPDNKFIMAEGNSLSFPTYNGITYTTETGFQIAAKSGIGEVKTFFKNRFGLDIEVMESRLAVDLRKLPPQ